MPAHHAAALDAVVAVSPGPGCGRLTRCLYRFAMGLSGLSLLALTACASLLPRPPFGANRSRARVVDREPPAARVEAIPAAPSAQHVWVDGQWLWQGGAYEWSPGLWQLLPEPDAYYALPLSSRAKGVVRHRRGVWHRADGSILPSEP